MAERREKSEPTIHGWCVHRIDYVWRVKQYPKTNRRYRTEHGISVSCIPYYQHYAGIGLASCRIKQLMQHTRKKSQADVLEIQ